MQVYIFICIFLFLSYNVVSFRISSSNVRRLIERTNVQVQMSNNVEPIATKQFYASKVLSFLTMTSMLTISMVKKANAEKPYQDKSNTSEITQKVYLYIKIANYTEESVGTNKGATGSGRVVIGLYGKDAPESVERFLSVIDGDGQETPNFLGSQFTRVAYNQLLEMEHVRGIGTTNIAGAEVLTYRDNTLLTSFKPIMETNLIRHDRAGLLTRRQLTSGPEFGITLAGAPSLDGFHVVFGRVLEGLEVLDAISKIPTYTYKTSTGYVGQSKESEVDQGGIADAWFEGQRSLFVDIGKSFGDQRAVDQRGRLLRRVTVKDAGRL